jgi:surface protein
MRITATTVALLIHHAATADKASKGPAKGGKGKKGKSGKGTAAPTGALCTSANSFNNTSLREAVTDYFDQACLTNITCGIITQYGVIGGWRVCEVTEMVSLFANFDNYQAANFNESLNDWDVSKVTTMYQMFQDAVAYNQPMNDWDVSKVTTMATMFRGAAAFNQPLNNWNVSKVTTMVGMFYDATAYNQPLCDWGTKLQKTAYVNDMFIGSGCANKAAPDLTSAPPGPFCAAVCGGLF